MYRNQFIPLLQQKFISFDFFLADRGIPYLFLKQSAFFFFLLIAPDLYRDRPERMFFTFFLNKKSNKPACRQAGKSRQIQMLRWICPAHAQAP